MLLITACTRKEWPIDHKIIEGKEVAIAKLTEARALIAEHEEEKAFKRTRSGLKRLETQNRKKKKLKSEEEEYKKRHLAIFVERIENLSDLDVAE